MRSGLTLLAVLAAITAMLACAPARAQVQTQIQVVGYNTSALSANNATSYSVTVPSGVLPGDFMLFVGSNNPGTGGGAPATWTYLASNITTNNAVGYSLWYRIATSADVAGSTVYTWTVTGSSRVAGAITAFRGVDNTNPVLAYGTLANGTQSASTSTTSRTAPSVTPGSANATIVALYSASNGSADTPTAPTGMTKIFAAGTGDGSNGVFLSAYYERFAAAAATGTFVSNSGNSISAYAVGGTVALQPATVSPSAYWHFDESGWNGTSGEVVDSGGSGYNGVAAHSANTSGTTPAISGTPGTCNYGTFNGSTQYVEMPASLPHEGNEFTVTAWIKPTANQLGRIWLDDESYNGYGISFYDSGSAKLRIYSRQPSTVYVDSNITLSLNTWYFVALVSDVTIANGWYLIILDSSGSLLDSTSLLRTSFSAGTGAHATVGGSDDGETQGTLAHFAGNIDEVTLFQYDLPIPSLEVWAMTTHPCGTNNASNFKITNSNYGIYCAPQAVTLTAYDGSGNPYTAYTGTVALSTSTGKGTWTLTTGSGTFSDPIADDGAATYTFPGTQSSATFALSYQDGGATVTAHATQSTPTVVTDDGTQGAIVFSPSGFTVTSSPFSNPSGGIPAFASPEIAGTSFNVYLTAYGTTPTNNTCGIITTYTGAKSLNFWSTYVNPATGTVACTINGTGIATTESGSATQSVTFSSGQATVSAKYKDAGSLSISMKDATTGNPSLPTGIRGSTGTFVSQPANLVLSNIKRTSDSFANPAASTAAGTVFIGAGQSFTATVTALESGGTATPNFGKESTPATVTLTPNLVLPASGNDPLISGSFGSFSGGAATGTAFGWPDVGIITITPSSSNYLASGSTVVGTTTGNVGRFIPNNFAVAENTPLFATSCAAGAFTYVGQPFVYAVAPVITATAQSLGGTTTQNYSGSLFRLSNASLTGRSYTPTPSSPALTLTGLPATTADPTIVSAGLGVATLTFSAGTGISFARGSAIPSFAANIALSVNVIDQDGVTATNPVTFGSGSGIGFSSGANQYYGRTAIRSVLGSELLDLPMPLTNQYYVNATTGFTTNTADSCSTAPSIAFSSYQVNLTAACVQDSGRPGVSGAGCTAAGPAASRYYSTASAGVYNPSAASAGSYNLILAAPGSGNNGAVTVIATPPAWLQYQWNASSGTLPSGVATFGLFPGPPSRIYEREVY